MKVKLVKFWQMNIKIGEIFGKLRSKLVKFWQIKTKIGKFFTNEDQNW